MAEETKTPVTPNAQAPKIRAIKDIKAKAKYLDPEVTHSLNTTVKTTKGKPDVVQLSSTPTSVTADELKSMPVFIARRHRVLFMLEATQAELDYIQTLTVQEIASAYRA